MHTMSAFDFVRTRRPLLVAFIVFVLAGAAAATMVWHGEQHNRHEQRERVVNLTIDHANTVQRNVEHALSAAYTLAALVHQGNGNVPAFEQIANRMLPLFPDVAGLALAPGG